jgi:hypothetical protein
MMKPQVKSTILTGVTVLLLTGVIVPAAQIASGASSDSAAWSVVAFAILGFGIVVVIVGPRLASTWARRKMALALKDDPDQITSLVAVLDEDGGHGEPGVLVVNSRGATVLGRTDALFVAEWKTIVRVDSHPRGQPGAETALQSRGEQVLSFTDTLGIAMVQMIPLNRSGAGHLPDWKAEELCRTINAVRIRGAS